MPYSEQQAPGSAEPTSTHSQARTLLPDYVSDLVLRSVDLAPYAPLIAHLHTCLSCRQEAAELVELLQATVAGDLQPAPTFVPPRLDFLPAAPVCPWERDSTGRLAVQFTPTLLDQTRRPHAAAVRTSGRVLAPTPLFQYDQASYEPAQEPSQTPLTISVFGLGTEPTTIDVVVRVGVAGRGVDLSGSEVILTSGQSEHVERTDRFGYAYFRGLPIDSLPNLQIAIVPRG